MNIYSLEEEQIVKLLNLLVKLLNLLVKLLNLPSHMTTVELGDLMVYCTSCSEGKFIQSENDKVYHELENERNKTHCKLGDPEFDLITARIANHFCDKIKNFADKHRSCLPLDKEKQITSLRCLY